MSDYELVVPFVVCQSKGGPYDDEAYVAGFEAGSLDAILRYDVYLEAQGFQPQHDHLGQPFHAENRDQLNLIAMRYGYTVEFTESGDATWVYASFSRHVAEQ